MDASEGLLICGECRCASDELASGWVACTGNDPERIEATGLGIMCPVCATREFESQPEVAEGYA